MGKIITDETSARAKEPTDPTSTSRHACKCGQEAVYLRVQEGAHYCSRCLSRQVERNFFKTIAKGRMIKKGDIIAVGVSGGKDSMVLLHLMHKISKKIPISIIAVTIDEGIEGYRNRSIEKVNEFVTKLGVDHRIFSFKENLGFKIDNLNRQNISGEPSVIKHCTYCGVFRRSLLNKAAREVGADKIAVGHNLDDEAQSVFMNVMRGDVKRVKRVSKDGKFVPRVKPLKNILEKEIVAYAIVNNIPYFDGECPNSFNNVRRDIQTMLNGLESKYPGTKSQMIKFSEKISIIPQAGEVNHCTKCGEPASQQVCKACELLEKAKARQINYF